MGRPKWDIFHLIDSNVDLFMYLIKGIRVRYMKRSTFELDLISNCVKVNFLPFLKFSTFFARYFGWEWPLMSAWIWQDTSISWTITESHKPPSGKFNLVPAQTRKEGVFGHVHTIPGRSMCQNRNTDMVQYAVFTRISAARIKRCLWNKNKRRGPDTIKVKRRKIIIL